MTTLQFINTKTEEQISSLYEIDFNITFDIGQTITIEGISYIYIKKSTAFYKDADGQQILTSLFLQQK